MRIQEMCPESNRAALFPSSHRCVFTWAEKEPTADSVTQKLLEPEEEQAGATVAQQRCTVIINHWNKPPSVHADTPNLTTSVCTHVHRQIISLDLMSEPPTCCICLDEFTSPAPLPCGHRFCLGCIGEFWRIHGACQCPLCKAFFPHRPQLKTDQTQHAVAPDEEGAVPLKAGEVPCDLCPAKRRAVKSCLECMASYCATHLEPHYQDEALGRHLLINVLKNLEDSVCRLHGKQLNRFCRSDRTCICAMCAQTEHRGHHLISINKEVTKRKVKLKWRKLQLQQAIQENLSKVKSVTLSADLSTENPKEAWAQNKDLLVQLEEEICELQRKHAELDQLSQTEDDVLFLQRFLHKTST